MQNMIGFIVFFLLSAFLTGAMIFLASVLGPKKKTPEKQVPYECGVDPVTLPEARRPPVHFYVMAMMFIIFDIELAFLFPWAVMFRELGWLGFAEIGFFVFFLLLAYIYAWRRHALEAESS